MAKTKTTINFSDYELVIEKGADILSGEQFIFQILDPNSTVLYANAGYPALGESPSFAAPDLDQATTDTVVLSIGSLTTAIVQGTYTINYYNTAAGKEGYGAITVIYCPVLPEVDIALSYSCLTAIMTLTDSATYAMTCSCTGESITPTATQVPVLKYPTDMEVAIANLPGSGATLSSTDLWSHTWTGTMTTTLSYAMPTDSYTGITTFYIDGELTGVDTVYVACDDCSCQMLDCIEAIFRKYQAALVAVNSFNVYKYGNLFEQILGLWMLYERKKQCGTEDELRELCGEMKDLIGDECTCCDEEDDNDWSTEITAVSSSSTSTAGSKILFGEGVPSDSIGANGDMYINTLNGAVYSKILGAWELQYTMTLTSLLSNYIMHEVYTPVSTVSGTLATLGTTTFNLADVKDGSVLAMEANLTFEEDTSADTQVQIVIDGETAVTDDFYVDTTNDGTSFTVSFKVSYYIEDTGGLGTLYIVARKFELAVNDAVIKTSFIKGMTLELSTTGNSFTIKGKTDGSKYISLDTLKVIQQQTTD